MANYNSDNKETNNLITERDIDPEFGLFSEEAETDQVRSAEQELLDTYTQPGMLEENDSQADEINLDAVPDADDISENSPIDPASPPDEFHGTDLINGVGNDPEDETES
jgi:hypothetical protein